MRAVAAFLALACALLCVGSKIITPVSPPAAPREDHFVQETDEQTFEAVDLAAAAEATGREGMESLLHWAIGEGAS